MFAADEITCLQVRSVPSLESDTPILVSVEVRTGERLDWYAWTPGQEPESHASFQARLSSDIQDFVAESSMGWGELRGRGSFTEPTG
jgi:hypothetical protein